MRHDVALLKPLGRREIEILQQIADGIPTREIAAASNTSLQVIKNHTYRAAQKLGADNRGHLIAVAFRAGFIKGACDESFPFLRCAFSRRRFSFSCRRRLISRGSIQRASWGPAPLLLGGPTLPDLPFLTPASKVSPAAESRR